jgi:hypothetical protein
MILFLVSVLLSFQCFAEGSGYEVDTDEEVSSGLDTDSAQQVVEEEVPAEEEVKDAGVVAPAVATPPVKVKRKIPSRASGTRAQNRFAQDEIRSAPKSVYKKNGSALDVDTD